MKKTFFNLMILAGLLVVSEAHAEWLSISNGVGENDIHIVVTSPKDPAVIFAGSDRAVYSSADGGTSWREILRLHATDSHVLFININSSDPKIIYIGTDQGIYRSEDGGKRWSLFFAGSGN